MRTATITAVHLKGFRYRIVLYRFSEHAKANKRKQWAIAGLPVYARTKEYAYFVKKRWEDSGIRLNDEKRNTKANKLRNTRKELKKLRGLVDKIYASKQRALNTPHQHQLPLHEGVRI